MNCPPPNNLGHLTTPVFAQMPDEVAIFGIGRKGISTLTYRQLEERSEAVASYLGQAGIRSGDRIALIVKNQIEYIEVLFGILRAGAIAVPINVRSGTQRIKSILEDCDPRGVITDASLHPETASYLGDLKINVRLVIDGNLDGWLAFDQIVEAFINYRRTEAQPPYSGIAMCVYTSGSTGKPKGVIVSHQAALFPVRASPYHRGVSSLTGGPRSLIAMPLTHEAAFSSIKEALAFGGAAVILEEFRAKSFLKSLSAVKCSATKIVPSMGVALLEEKPLLRSLDFSNLKMVAIGGAPSDKGLLLSLQNAFPLATIRQFYGMTECGNIFSRRSVNSVLPPIDSLGVPANNIEVRLGEDDLQDIGELYVRTPTMMDGYNRGVEADRLSKGWLRTGDVFFRDDRGFYYFKGRADDMFVSGGENIFPAEIENILLRHPDVKMVSICSVASYARGQAPFAFVVKRDGGSVTEDDLLAFYDQTGAAFARPEYIYFTAELPLNQTGKVDRLVLSAKAGQLLKDGRVGMHS